MLASCLALVVLVLSNSANALEPSAAVPAEKLTDKQLTARAADWGKLDGSQRTDLIQETRERLAPSGISSGGASGGASGVVNTSPPHPVTDDARPGAAASATDGQAQPNTSRGTSRGTIERRRYGRLVRKADGSVVRIETQVVRIQRGDPRRAYGVGFERRHDQPSGGAVRNDVLTVQDPGAAQRPRLKH